MDYAYMKAIEGPIVDGVGLGYPGFFALPGQVSAELIGYVVYLFPSPFHATGVNGGPPEESRGHIQGVVPL